MLVILVGEDQESTKEQRSKQASLNEDGQESSQQQRSEGIPRDGLRQDQGNPRNHPVGEQIPMYVSAMHPPYFP